MFPPTFDNMLHSYPISRCSDSLTPAQPIKSIIYHNSDNQTPSNHYLGGEIFHALIYIIGTKKIFICENGLGRPEFIQQ